MSAYDEMDAHAPDLEIVHYPQDGLRGDNILLNLDAACLAARQSKFDQAKKYIAAVLAGPALINPSYGAKIAELASIYEKNQRLDEAIVFFCKRCETKKWWHRTDSPDLICPAHFS